jgi:hypothetical protein
MKGSGAVRPSSLFYVHEADVVQVHHFLDECSLCAKTLSGDIFMYRSERLPTVSQHVRGLHLVRTLPCNVCVLRAEVTRRSVARSAGSSRSRWTGPNTGGRSAPPARSNTTGSRSHGRPASASRGSTRASRGLPRCASDLKNTRLSPRRTAHFLASSDRIQEHARLPPRANLSDIGIGCTRASCVLQGLDFFFVPSVSQGYNCRAKQ